MSPCNSIPKSKPVAILGFTAFNDLSRLTPVVSDDGNTGKSVSPKVTK